MIKDMEAPLCNNWKTDARMRRMIIAALAAVAGMVPMYGQKVEMTLAERASNFYTRGEWASSRAAYTTLARENAGTTEYWVRGIVSSLMADDEKWAREETLAGIDSHIPIDTIFEDVFRETISHGKSDMYERYITGLKASDPWLGRVVDRCLLKYYLFRDDAGNIVATATSLLESTPDNLLFLPALAYGQLLSGDMEGMAATNKRILELDSHNLDALLYLANYYYGQWKKGATEMKNEALDYVARAERFCKTPQTERMLAELQR